MKISFRPVPCLQSLSLSIASLSLVSALGQTHNYLGAAGFNRLWEDPNSWASPPTTPQRFYPHNGDSAYIVSCWVTFSTNPVITDLTVQSPIDSVFLLNEKSFQIDGTFDFVSAEFRNGTLMVNKADYLSLLVLDGVTATFSEFKPNDGMLTLKGGSTLKNVGEFIYPPGGITSQGLNNFIDNRGDFIKSSGGTSLLTIPFIQNSGSLQAQSGTLRFNDNSTIRNGRLTSGGGLEFQDITLIQNAATLETTGSGYISFSDFVNISGPMSSTGTPDGTGHIRMSGSFSCSSLFLSEDAPLVMLKGRQSSSQTLTNSGSIRWEGGELGPMINQASTRGHFVIQTNPYGISNPGASNPTLVGSLTNPGYILQEGRTLTLNPGVDLSNPGIYEMSGGSIVSVNPGIPGQFQSLGTLKKSALAGSETLATIDVPLTASDIQVESGQLALGTSGTLTGVIEIDNSSNTNSKVLLRSGAEKIELQNLLLSANDGGILEIENAWVELTGSLSTAGTNGLLHLKNQDASLTTSAGAGTTITSTDLVPFQVGDSSNKPTLAPDGALTSVGPMTIVQARLSGSTLISEGPLTIFTDLEFVDSVGAGTILKNTTDSSLTQNGIIKLGDRGKLIIESGTHSMTSGAQIQHTAGTSSYELQTGSQLNYTGNPDNPDSLAADNITIDGQVTVASGDLTLEAPSLFESNSGAFQIQSAAKLSFNHTLTGTGADFSVYGTLASTELLEIPANKTLRGDGIVQSNLNQIGTLAIEPALGSAPADLTIQGNLIQLASSQTELTVTPDSNDVLLVTGTAQLAGTLLIDTENLAQIPAGVPIVILTAASLSGEFDELVFSPDPSAADQFQVEYTANQVTLTRTPGGLSYDDWAMEAFEGITDPEIIGTTKDPDNDGVQNAFEYLLGSDPLKASPGPSVTVTLVPADENPGEIYLEVRFPIAPDRNGYELKLIDLNDMGNPDDNTEFPTNLEILDDEVIFTSASPVTEEKGFFHISLRIE